MISTSNYFMRMLFKNTGCAPLTVSILWCFITALGMLWLSVVLTLLSSVLSPILYNVNEWMNECMISWTCTPCPRGSKSRLRHCAAAPRPAACSLAVSNQTVSETVRRRARVQCRMSIPGDQDDESDETVTADTLTSSASRSTSFDRSTLRDVVPFCIPNRIWHFKSRRIVNFFDYRAL